MAHSKKSKQAESLERLRKALSEAYEALRELEKEQGASTQSQPPGPGQPPPKEGGG